MFKINENDLQKRNNIDETPRLTPDNLAEQIMVTAYNPNGTDTLIAQLDYLNKEIDLPAKAAVAKLFEEIMANKTAMKPALYEIFRQYGY